MRELIRRDRRGPARFRVMNESRLNVFSLNRNLAKMIHAVFRPVMFLWGLKLQVRTHQQVAKVGIAVPDKSDAFLIIRASSAIFTIQSIQVLCLFRLLNANIFT